MDKAELDKRLQEFIGVEAAPPRLAPDPVNERLVPVRGLAMGAS